MAHAKKMLAVFDFDKTISRRDTYIPFLLEALKARPWRLFPALLLPFALFAYYCGFIDNTKLKKVFLRAILGGASRTQVDAIASRFADKIYPSGLLQDAMRAIAHHQEQGHCLLLASASFDIYISPLGKKLGFDATFCTKAAWHNDVLTGDIDGKNCYGQEKRDAVARFIENKRSEYHIIAYSDHHSDLPLLQWADEAYAVNPTSKLSALLSPQENIHTVNWS